MLGDPLFWLVSIPGVLLYGVAKGGFGGAVAILAVPLMALVMPPVQAAAILLPILVVMDAVVVRTFWGNFDWRAHRALAGTALTPHRILSDYCAVSCAGRHQAYCRRPGMKGEKKCRLSI